MQANLGDQWTILFVAGITYFSGIVTIWIPITMRRLEDTLCALRTGPPIRVLNSRICRKTLTFAERVSHISAVLAEGLSLSDAGHGQVYAAVFVTWNERKSTPGFGQSTLASA